MKGQYLFKQSSNGVTMVSSECIQRKKREEEPNETQSTALPHLYCLIYTASNHIGCRLVEIWKRKEKACFQTILSQTEFFAHFWDRVFYISQAGLELDFFQFSFPFTEILWSYASTWFPLYTHHTPRNYWAYQFKESWNTGLERWLKRLRILAAQFPATIR